MHKKAGLGKYLFSLKHIMVAPKLLSVLHTIAQACILITALVILIAAVKNGIMYGVLALFGCIVWVPIASLFVRAYFELIMVPFSLAKNVRKIKKWLFGCECDGGCCGDEMDMTDFSPDMLEAIFAGEATFAEETPSEPLRNHKIPEKKKEVKEVKKETKKAVSATKSSKKVSSVKDAKVVKKPAKGLSKN